MKCLPNLIIYTNQKEEKESKRERERERLYSNSKTCFEAKNTANRKTNDIVSNKIHISHHCLPPTSNSNPFFQMSQSLIQRTKINQETGLICVFLPERIGWIPFKKIETARRGKRSETATITSLSLVKALLRPTRNTSTTIQRSKLMRTVVMFTTTTDNLATRGFPAPSSLLTRTLLTKITQNVKGVS